MPVYAHVSTSRHVGGNDIWLPLSLDRSQADKFVGMYVNDWTLDFGARGREAVATLLNRAYEAKIIPHAVDLEFIG